MQHYNEEQTRSALPAEQLIQSIERFFVQGCEVPLRHNHPILDESGEFLGNFLLMPAWQVGGFLGLKTVCVFPNNQAHQLPALHSIYTLYRADTGIPIATFDGDVITSRRTAAASALAGRYLSRSDSCHLLIVGAGRVGSLLAEMYRAVRPITQVSIYNPSPNKAHALADTLNRQGINASVVTDLATAVGQADIVSCATLSTQPLIKRAWLRAGTHLDLIGSFKPEMTETDSACFFDTSVFIDTDEALMKAGDILLAIADKKFDKSRVKSDLAGLCQGKHKGRSCDDEITVFKSVGTGLEDLAAASLAYQRLCQV